MFLGKSYWHTTPALGPRFVPGRLEGYVRDFWEKSRWSGPVDERGLPLCERHDGLLFVFPTTVFQKALGEWELWLASDRQDDDRKEAFLAIASWAVAAQDDRGGWPPWTALGLEHASAYDAMTQGQGISVLVRARAMTEDGAFLEAARRGAEPILTPVHAGGASRCVPEGLVLEEVPLEPPNTVLNGWIYSLYGLYDLSLATNGPQIDNALDDSLAALVAYLPRYDAGYWSYYDTRGNLASPYYHREHIVLLEGLEMTFPKYSDVFGEMGRRFQKQMASPANRLRAVCCKAIQKLRNPPDLILK